MSKKGTSPLKLRDFYYNLKQKQKKDLVMLHQSNIYKEKY